MDRKVRIFQERMRSLGHHEEAEERHDREVARLGMILVSHEEDGPGDGQRRGAEDRVQHKPAAAALAQRLAGPVLPERPRVGLGARVDVDDRKRAGRDRIERRLGRVGAIALKKSAFRAASVLSAVTEPP